MDLSFPELGKQRCSLFGAQIVVEENYIRLDRRECRERLIETSALANHAKAWLGLKHPAQAFPEQAVIIHDQNADVHWISSDSARCLRHS
jgi:hypothetical protein